MEGGVFAIFAHKINAFLQAAKEPTISWGHTLAIICYTDIVWYFFLLFFFERSEMVVSGREAEEFKNVDFLSL